jgi:hypothetical protein
MLVRQGKRAERSISGVQNACESGKAGGAVNKRCLKCRWVRQSRQSGKYTVFIMPVGQGKLSER